MSIAKSLFLQTCNIIPIKWLQKVSPIELYLPYHHLVTDYPSPHVSHLYTFKNVKEFEDDLRYLSKYFQTVTVEQVIEHVQNGSSLPKNSFLLTFDDGFKEVRTVVAPLLAKYKIPAIFFLNSSFIDNKELFYRLKVSLLIEELKKNPAVALVYAKHLGCSLQPETIISHLKKINYNNKELADKIAGEIGFSFTDFLEKEEPFLTTGQVNELIEMGFTIGAHSKDHPFLPLLSTTEQIEQIDESTEILQNKFDLPHRLFAFPHSDSEVKQEVISNVLSKGMDLLFGIQNQKLELHNKILHRFNAERPSISLRKQVKAEIIYTYLLNKLGKLQVSRG